MILIKCVALLLVATTVMADYTGYQLLRLSPKTKEQIDLIGQWVHNNDFDIWANREHHIDVLLSPEAFNKYKPQLEEKDVEINVINRNIQNNMDEEARSIVLQKMQLKALGQENRVVNTFSQTADIYTWMQNIANANSFVTYGSAGKTSQGRDLAYVTIQGGSRRIWIDCGIHAREWVSPATCVWIIDALVRERNANNADVLAILAKYTIQILPVQNPDGYDYSFTAGQRLWRKNRRVNAGSTCLGVDLNRNFGYQWMVAGASNLPCSDTYAGPSRDSELETQATENEINKYPGQWDAFFTIHTYGQFWFTPWGYTSALPSDYNDLVKASNVGTSALQAVYGTRYSVGSSTVLLYAAAGGSDDWAKGTAGIKYAHCLELRPADTGLDSQYGFQLPVDRVPKVGEETYAGIKAFLKALPLGPY